jgi:hypothetical protein
VSILTTLTRETHLVTAVPLSWVAGNLLGSPWLPNVSYALDRIHQFGQGVPPDSGFQPSHVPDQFSTNQTLGVDSQAGRWRVAYRLNRSFQDNRQAGRLQADLQNLTHHVALDLTLDPGLDMGVEFGFEGADNREVQRTDRTRRVGLRGGWRPTSRASVNCTFATTLLSSGENPSFSACEN